MNPNSIREVRLSLARNLGGQDQVSALKWLIEGGGQTLPHEWYTQSYEEILDGYLAKSPQEVGSLIEQLVSGPRSGPRTR